MSDIADFKKIADSIMSDVVADEELKRKTLARCTRKKHAHAIMSKVLVSAACFALILGVLKIPGLLPGRLKTTDDGSQINILVAESGDTVESIPEQDNAIDMGISSVQEWQLETMDEAKSSFGTDFLTPSYMPESFELTHIQASGGDKHAAERVILSYLAGDKSISIVEEKSTADSAGKGKGITGAETLQERFAGYKTVYVNGTEGYLRSTISDAGGKTSVHGTELYWLKDGVHYSVIGLLTEDETVRIAESMK